MILSFVLVFWVKRRTGSLEIGFSGWFSVFAFTYNRSDQPPLLVTSQTWYSYYCQNITWIWLRVFSARSMGLIGHGESCWAAQDECVRTAAWTPLDIPLENQRKIIFKCSFKNLTITKIGFVFFRRYDPIPAEFLKIDRQRVSAASRLVRTVVAVEPQRALRSVLLDIRQVHFEERDGLENNCWNCRDCCWRANELVVIDLDLCIENERGLVHSITLSLNVLQNQQAFHSNTPYRHIAGMLGRDCEIRSLPVGRVYD